MLEFEISLVLVSPSDLELWLPGFDLLAEPVLVVAVVVEETYSLMSEIDFRAETGTAETEIGFGVVAATEAEIERGRVRQEDLDQGTI